MLLGLEDAKQRVKEVNPCQTDKDVDSSEYYFRRRWLEYRVHHRCHEIDLCDTKNAPVDRTEYQESEANPVQRRQPDQSHT